MQTKFILGLTLVVLYSVLVVAPQPASPVGSTCSNAQSITGNPFASGNPKFEVTSPYTATSSPAYDPSPALGYQSGSGSIPDGPCYIAGGSLPARPRAGYWYKWAPSTDTVASIELTDATHNAYAYDIRLLIFSVSAAVDADTSGNGPCDKTSGWLCEGRIKDICQAYPNQPAPFTFLAGRVYYFMQDTNNTAPTSFYLSFIKRTVIFKENFEEVTNPPPALPTNWYNTTAAENGGWRVDTPANADSETIKIANIDATNVGGVGNKIGFVNPGKNGAYGEKCTSTPCDHTRDVLTSSWFSLKGQTAAQLFFSTYFYDGTNDQQREAQVTASIDISVDNGTTFTRLYNLTSVTAANTGSWYTEKVDLAKGVGYEGVRLRFIYSQKTGNTPLYTWSFDNLLVVPSVDYDMCTDGYTCTYHTCNSPYQGTPTDKPRGCVANKNNTVCSAASVTCMSNLCDPSSSSKDATSGCVFTPDSSKCNDGRTCTVDTCSRDGVNTTTGCSNLPTAGFCNDNKGCTTDICANYTNQYYLNADATTGCYFKPSCDDEIACTDDTCEEVPATGDQKCLHTINVARCDDNIDCTYELTCDPEEPGYDVVKGCIRIPMNEWCDDNDPCTIDTCEPSINLTNSCVNKNVTCDDCLACTVDMCVDGACEHEPVHEACDDNFDCTVDICDESLGKCTNTPNDTYCEYFNDPCHHMICVPHQAGNPSGCLKVAKVCDDQIPCTEDMCDMVTGDCVFTENNTKCDDDLDCTVDACNANIGKCTNKPDSSLCNDGDKCTIDFCSMNGTCDSYPKDCSDEVLCSDDSCDAATGECVNNYNNTNCDDGFACTQDSCDEDLGRCANIPSDLYCNENGSPCYISYCNVESTSDPSGCYSVAKDCSDAITCTYDYCDEETGECKHEANNTYCDDGHDCTDDSCDVISGRCINVPNNANCEDNDVCTKKDICGDDGNCHYVPLYCNDQIYCTMDFCDSETVEGCQFVENHTLCDDGNDCTHDYCSVELGRCVNIPMDSWCPGRHPSGQATCETGYCSLEAGKCVYESHDDWCDDSVGCSLDVCDGANGCVHTLRDSLCDDGIGCTSDSCNGTGCQYTPHNSWCDDDISCTEDICSTTEDCLNEIIPNFCDDEINCTRDWCSIVADCQNEPMNSWCSDGVGCTVDTCVPDDTEGLYCHNVVADELCGDDFSCSRHTCDLDAGCVSNFTLCPWYNRNVDDKICINCMSSSGQIEQTHYADGTGAMSLRTMNTDGFLQDNVVLTPDNSVIIGGDQMAIPISKHDGLVVGTNMRIVPRDSDFELPQCNEIRRGTIVIVQEEVECGDEVCHEDVVKICIKDSEYHYVTLETQQTDLNA